MMTLTRRILFWAQWLTDGNLAKRHGSPTSCLMIKSKELDTFLSLCAEDLCFPPLHEHP